MSEPTGTDPYPEYFASAVDGWIDFERTAADHHRSSRWQFSGLALAAVAAMAVVHMAGGLAWPLLLVVAACTWVALALLRDERRARARQHALERLAAPENLQRLWDRAPTFSERLAFVMNPVQAEKELSDMPDATNAPDMTEPRRRPQGVCYIIPNEDETKDDEEVPCDLRYVGLEDRLHVWEVIPARAPERHWTLHADLFPSKTTLIIPVPEPTTSPQEEDAT